MPTNPPNDDNKKADSAEEGQMGNSLPNDSGNNQFKNSGNHDTNNSINPGYNNPPDALSEKKEGGIPLNSGEEINHLSLEEKSVDPQTGDKNLSDEVNAMSKKSFHNIPKDPKTRIK